MIRRVNYVGISCNLHARIVRFAAEVHELNKSDLPVVVSTDINHLLHYASSNALALVGTNTRFVWMLLDSSDLAYGQSEVQFKISRLVDSRNISLEIYAVGDLGGLLGSVVDDVTPRLIYDQRKTSRLILNTRDSLVKSLKLGFFPSYFFLAKDLYSSPKCAIDACLAPRKELVFVGHSGLVTAIKALRGIGMSDWEAKLQDLCLPCQHINNTLAMPDSIRHWQDLRSFANSVLQAAFGRVETTDKKVMFFILERSLIRLLVLSALNLTSSLMVVLYPRQFLNAMHWPQFLAPRFLDLGGINGLERLYPRSVDLLMRSQRFIRTCDNSKFDYFYFRKDLFDENIRSLFTELEEGLCLQSQKILRNLI